MEPSNPPTYYIDLYIRHLSFILIKQINTIYWLMLHTSALFKNTT